MKPKPCARSAWPQQHAFTHSFTHSLVHSLALLLLRSAAPSPTLLPPTQEFSPFGAISTRLTTDGGEIVNLSCGFEFVMSPLGFPSGPCNAEVCNQTRHPGWSVLKNNMKYVCSKTYGKNNLTNRGGMEFHMNNSDSTGGVPQEVYQGTTGKVYPSKQELLDMEVSERMNFDSMLDGAMDENRWRYGFGLPGELISYTLEHVDICSVRTCSCTCACRNARPKRTQWQCYAYGCYHISRLTSRTTLITCLSVRCSALVPLSVLLRGRVWILFLLPGSRRAS